MNSYFDKKEQKHETKDHIYKIKKIAPICLIKDSNQKLMRKKLSAIKTTNLNESNQILNSNLNSFYSGLMNSKRKLKNNSILNQSVNPSSNINKVNTQIKKATSTSNNKDINLKKKRLINIVSFPSKSLNQYSLNKEKTFIGNSVKKIENKNNKTEKEKKNQILKNKKFSQSCNNNLCIKKTKSSLSKINLFPITSRDNSLNHKIDYSFFQSNYYTNTNRISYRNERSNSFQNSFRISLSKKETSITKKVSINILRERQNNLEKKKMYKSFLNQKKIKMKNNNLLLNININKNLLELDRSIKQKTEKLMGNISKKKIQVNREKENEKDKIDNLKKTHLLKNSLNLLYGERNKYLRTYSNSMINESHSDNLNDIINILNSKDEFEIIEDNKEIDIDSIAKKINYDEIRINAKSIFSHKYNKEYEFYTSKFNKNFEEDFLRNSFSYFLNTTSSTITRRKKNNSSSKSLVYINQL